VARRPFASRAHPAVAIQASAADTGEAVELQAERALATAEEGATLARDAGFDAEPQSLRTDGSIGEAIVDYADRHPTHLVVIGTRGLSGLREALTGSVTHHVTQHVHVPVFAVPPEHTRAAEPAVAPEALLRTATANSPGSAPLAGQATSAEPKRAAGKKPVSPAANEHDRAGQIGK
jgi:nucleotide-binding universal stress UspA family protein